MSDSIGRLYMQKTRPSELEPSAQSRGIPQPPLELPYPTSINLIHLPEPENVQVPPLDVRTAIEKRSTLRRYQPDALSTEELSFLLWCTQGVKQITNRPSTLRTVPSAGARHAFETYVLVNRVDSINPGLYRYIALQHSLSEINLSPQIVDEITHACFDQEMVRQSAVTFIWVAVVERMAWRYGERGYRYLHLDAGHVCQNLYLAAENLQCGVCAIAAFDDDNLNSVLGLDGEALFAIYLGSVGKRKYE
jgi:SagB-type dehydrogenase family enzyme